MHNIICFELSRALNSIRFRAAAVLGIIIAVLHFLVNVMPITKWLDIWKGDPFLTPHSAYGHWIGMDSSTIWPVLLFMVLPLLAAVPTADSYWFDNDSGYLSQIRLRCKLQHYKIAKSLSVLASAFLVTAIPLVTDFLLTSAVLPCITPEAASNLYSITDRSIFGSWFYHHPMMYILGCIIFDSLFMSVWTTLSLSVSRWLKQRFHILLAPFLIYMLIYFFSVWSGLLGVSPMAYLLPFQPVGGLSPFIPCLMLIGVLMILVLTYFIEWSQKNEK